MSDKSIHRVGVLLLFAAGLAVPAAGNGLLVNAGAASADFNFLNPAYCNNSTGDVTSTAGPTLSASGACSSPGVSVSGSSAGTGVDSMTASAAAFASFGMIGASVDATEAGTESVMPSAVGGNENGAVAGADAQFADVAFLNIVGLAPDAPVTLTFGFTLSGSSITSFSSSFSGNNAPQIDYSLGLFLAQDADLGDGDSTNVNVFNGNPLLAGVYTVSTTVLNDENVFIQADLGFQVNFPVLPLGTGSFSASADADFINTAQLTSIGISDGTNSYSDYSLIGSSNNTDYQQVLSEQDTSSGAPEPGSMGLTVLGAGAIAWLRRKLIAA